MEMTGEQLIPVPQAEVWRGLNDPEVLKACIAGCESIEKVTDNEYRVSLVAAVGPVKAKFNGKLQLSGFLAWLSWLFIHIWFLIGFRNRVSVLANWFWNYVTYRRGARLITGHRSWDLLPVIAGHTSAKQATEAAPDSAQPSPTATPSA